MQDVHSIGGGSRLFVGGGDRRLRPNHYNHPNHQALKCPRCASPNTKFCYYNNYNLSQPRHFCKSCRRYWTKGGVLRNVPVGGGCRKAKCSKPKNQSQTALSPSNRDQRKENSHSSSESSSLTTTTTAAATEAVSAPSELARIQESKLFDANNSNPIFEASECGVFSEIGSFANLIGSTSDTMPFGFGNISDVTNPFSLNLQGQHNQWQPQKGTDAGEDPRMQEITAGLIDQTATVDLSSSHDRSINVGFGSMDWQANGDQGLFDIPNAVDQAYWSQSTQWADQDDNNPSLYLP